MPDNWSWDEYFSSKYCNKVIVGDIEKLDIESKLTYTIFDFIVFVDVLENIKSLKNINFKIKKYFKKDGYLII